MLKIDRINQNFSEERKISPKGNFKDEMTKIISTTTSSFEEIIILINRLYENISRRRRYPGIRLR